MHDEGRPGSGHKNLQNIDSHFQGPRQVRNRRVSFPAGLRTKKSAKNGSNLGRERDEKLDSTSQRRNSVPRTDPSPLSRSPYGLYRHPGLGCATITGLHYLILIFLHFYFTKLVTESKKMSFKSWLGPCSELRITL